MIFLKAEQRFSRYGLISLFFAWVPVIGDPGRYGRYFTGSTALVSHTGHSRQTSSLHRNKSDDPSGMMPVCIAVPVFRVVFDIFGNSTKWFIVANNHVVIRFLPFEFIIACNMNQFGRCCFKCANQFRNRFNFFIAGTVGSACLLILPLYLSVLCLLCVTAWLYFLMHFFLSHTFVSCSQINRWRVFVSLVVCVCVLDEWA